MTAHSFDAGLLTHLEILTREELGERFEELYEQECCCRDRGARRVGHTWATCPLGPILQNSFS